MTYLGMDVGAGEVKLAVAKNGTVRKLSLFRLGEAAGGSLPNEAFVRELRAFLRAQHITAGSCALCLPRDQSLIHSIRVPRMTAKQLRQNLPFQLHDYIRQEGELYVYDYAVTGTAGGQNGTPRQTELLAAAAPKAKVEAWRSALGRAGLRMSAAVPEFLTYRGLIASFEKRGSGSRPQEYCIVDMGARSVCIHMYRGDRYGTSHVFERGGRAVEAMAQSPGEDREEKLQGLYDTIAAEIQRAVNFYAFNTPGSNLQDLYFCGGLAQNAELMKAVRSMVRLRVHSAAELLPAGLDRALAERCAAAAGAAVTGPGPLRDAGYPSKTVVNLARREFEWKNVPPAVPAVAAAVAVLALVGKFGVADLVEPARQTMAQARQQQALSSRMEEETSGYDGVLETYRRELATQPGHNGQPDAMKCLSLVESELLDKAQVSSFTISSDTVTVRLAGVNLARVSSIYKRLTASELVAGVQVSTANTESDGGQNVTASLTIRLKTSGGTASSELGKKVLS